MRAHCAARAQSVEPAEAADGVRRTRRSPRPGRPAPRSAQGRVRGTPTRRRPAPTRATAAAGSCGPSTRIRSGSASAGAYSASSMLALVDRDVAGIDRRRPGELERPSLVRVDDHGAAAGRVVARSGVRPPWRHRSGSGPYGRRVSHVAPASAATSAELVDPRRPTRRRLRAVPLRRGATDHHHMRQLDAPIAPFSGISPAAIVDRRMGQLASHAGDRWSARPAMGRHPARRLHHGRQRALGRAPRPVRAPPATPRARRTWPASCGSPSKRDIGWLTVFGFSTENWVRPRAEVRHILGLHKKLFGRDRRAQRPQRARRSGSAGRSTPPAPRTPAYVQTRDPQGDRRHQPTTPAWCSPSPSTTAAGPSWSTPSGRLAPSRARRSRPIRSRPASTSPSCRRSTSLVRTSGERRISNFLLWQSAGAPSTSPTRRWPDFDAARARRSLTRQSRSSATMDGRSVHRHRLARPLDRWSPARRLADVIGRLPAAEARPGSRRWPGSSTAAIDTGRHLVVQAGTGTGKTLAYLVPAMLSGKRIVVATATKALQDQLAAQGPAVPRRVACPTPFEWAVLKGRSNYLCLQRLREVRADDDQGQPRARGLGRPPTAPRSPGIAAGRAVSDTGDLAELDWSPVRRGRGARSASAATSAPAPTGARWASRASPSTPADAPRSPTSSSSTRTSTA